MSSIKSKLSIKNHGIEIVTLVLYAGALILIMHFHEPWFDEAQAWLIARDATIRELLCTITHYEGHPPLWYFILMPLAKLGCPFELGIKAVNFTMATIAMGIFIFKAPFPKIIRCTIPFTYFFFYQYGVISRNYSLMMLGFVLSALFYKERNEKPFRFILALALLGGASAYGIVISMGIAAVWLWETLNKPISPSSTKIFWKSPRFYALLLFFIFTILMIICIIPYKDALSVNLSVEPRSRLLWFLYMLFAAPADAVCTDVFSVATNNRFNYELLFALIISFLINFVIFRVTKLANKLALFIVPYLLLAFFGGIVYFSNHHLGIIVMFYMFLFWCCFDEASNNHKIKAGHSSSISYNGNKFLSRIGFGLLFLSIAISMYWSITAAVNDIKFIYCPGRGAAEFIRDNRLDQLKIMVAWLQTTDPETGEIYYDFNSMEGIPTLAYFDKNIFFNFNHQANDKCYLTHKLDTNGYNTKMLLSNSRPDVLFMSSKKFINVQDFHINMDDYALVKSIHGHFIWKDKTIEDRQYIFLRRDLLKNYPDLNVIFSNDELILKNNAIFSQY